MKGSAFWAVGDSDGNVVRSGIALDGDVAAQTTAPGESVVKIARRISSDQDMWKFETRAGAPVLVRRSTPRVEKITP